MRAAAPSSPENADTSAPLTLSDVVDVDERVAVGGEAVPTHVRFVLGFDRAPSEDELVAVADLLAPFDVVQSVTPDGVEIVTANRDEPARQVPHIKDTVSRASEEAQRREAACAEQEAAKEERSGGLREEIGAVVDGA
ncbi:hypothetical protein [Mobilicoccus pelagius]|uniref:Uncharacterized protein n=1 Tax=Mobilicoccus pelagius NBRC 104925 TaxID=1089455 RepID=H5UQ22_9MICO|nr:hypothetical protein [Mobilicoccus pelagius]GAB47827.1 hypothetical protein MOPEL_029_01080 [Mobilicoccus pelagius NBRC 104925]